MSSTRPESSSPFWWFWERITDLHTGAYKLEPRPARRQGIGVPVVLIECVGRKCGKQRTHPLLCLADGDNLIVIASKGGTDRHPAWYHNLKASPETTAWWKGQKRRVRAREASGEERERLWRMMADAYPDYANYQRRTDRQIPVVVLEPV